MTYNNWKGIRHNMLLCYYTPEKLLCSEKYVSTTSFADCGTKLTRCLTVINCHLLEPVWRIHNLECIIDLFFPFTLPIKTKFPFKRACVYDKNFYTLSPKWDLKCFNRKLLSVIRVIYFV